MEKAAFMETYFFYGIKDFKKIIVTLSWSSEKESHIVSQ